MKGFILSFRSEFYKTRKTMGFWSAVLLPLLLCLFVFIGFFYKSDGLINNSSMELWLKFAAPILGVMGLLLMPMLIIFIAYSVNSLEHKADTWKTIFSLPISKLSVYAAKYFYAFFLVFFCLALFVLFTIGFGNLLGVIKPSLKFSEYSIASILAQIYFKFFLASLGILSIQFLLSLLFSDFIKPMGIGFVCVIVGGILAGNGWQYAYLFPYSHPMMAMKALGPAKNGGNHPSAMPHFTVDLLTKDTWVSLVIAVVVFIAGYFIVLKKSVK
ncbi:MAG: ABC transporter permease [Bacteroidota bacterium]|nr:ABC transporter permease [Bacteroidota bacterium]